VGGALCKGYPTHLRVSASPRLVSRNSERFLRAARLYWLQIGGFSLIYFSLIIAKIAK